METVKYSVTLEKNPNRVEAIMRLVWGFISIIVLMILGAIAMWIAWPVTFLTVLFLGKKIEILEKVLMAYSKGMADWTSYVMFLTDERPPIVPEF